MADARFLLFIQGMKSITSNLIRSTLFGLFIAVSAGRTLADNHDQTPTGWYDSNHKFHAYIAQPRQGNSPGVPQSNLADTPAGM
jgi:hypothetical protein